MNNYFEDLNNLQKNDVIKEMEEYAKANSVPIITQDGLLTLITVIKLTNAKKILEIGTAIAYSSSMMALLDESIKVDTIERDEKMYLQALENIKRNKIERQVKVHFSDALTIDNNELDTDYDLIFIDAAKAQYINFFEKYEVLLRKGGVIVSDNLLFHGLVENISEKDSRDLRQLVRKIKTYNDYLKNKESFDTTFLRIGDGIAISIKK